MGDLNHKPFIFVLMPLNDEFTDIYEVGIKAACRDAGACCERVDEQIFVESILQRIYNQITDADVIVADMTGRNPNVFYEVGYAHALKKQVILLTQQAEDIPFDLKHYPHIIYQGKIALLKSKLESRIRWCVETFNIPLLNSDLNFDFLMNGTNLINRPEIKLPLQLNPQWQQSSSLRAVTRLDVHNLSKTLVKPESFILALVTPIHFKSIEIPGHTYSTLSNGQRIYNIRITRPLFPDSWISVEIKFLISDSRQIGVRFELALRSFTQQESIDNPFVLEFSYPISVFAE